MTSKERLTVDWEFRKSVSESFNIFQATIAMIAIFIGFVFVSLLHLLTSVKPLTPPTILVIWLLVVAMLTLSLALLCFHATAHRVVRYWGIFYPVRIFNRIGALAFSSGLLSMFWSIAVLLWIKVLNTLSVIVAFSSIGLVVFGFYFRRMHGKATYMTNVDNVPNG
jgi:hypothetical protein